ncbi:MAG: GerMN domain-containing protein [Mycobacteriales bacterium]
MSPIDDELRRTLGGRAAEVAPMPDPIAGIEARAHRMHRQRQALGAACGVVLVGSAAVILPLLSQDRPPTPIPPSTASPSPATTAPAPSGAAVTQTSAAPTDLPAASATPATSASSGSEAAAPSDPPASGAAATAAPPEAGTAKAIYYLGDTGTRIALYREWRKSSATDAVRGAIELMLAPPRDPDYQTLWPVGTKLQDVMVDGDVATVDLLAEALGGSGGSAAACTSLQQLVWTVTAANPAIKRVALSVDGRTQGVVSQWWGTGCGPDAPMARHTPAIEVQALVQISKFQEGDTVQSRFTFGGEATVFEAVVSWSVVDAAGKELQSGTTLATGGAPARGEWQAIVVLDGVQRGDVVELRAWEASAEDGRVTNLDTKKVTIG